MANRTKPSMPIPTHPASLATVSGFLRSLLPVLQGDVTFLYHTPRHLPDPRSIPIQKVVLSITPTSGFYDALHSPTSNQYGPRAYNLAFLHRPWALERRCVPKTSTVLACHKAFDEEFTVGANFALTKQLGLAIGPDEVKGRVLKGYKGDLERRIGLVAGFEGGEGLKAGEMRERVRREFGDELEGEYGFEEDEEEASLDGSDGVRIKGVAIMNAFHPDEVDRVAHAALELGLVESMDACASLLYLTGAVRDEGLAAARAKRMRVICVGHKVCELWGINHLSERLRQEFPAVDVVVVDEEEEKPAARDNKIVAGPSIRLQS